MDSISKRIKLLRQSVDMTQKELSYKTGLSIQVISNMERGVTQPSAKDMLNIAQALNVSINSLYNLNEKNIKNNKLNLSKKTNVQNTQNTFCLSNLININSVTFPVVKTLKNNLKDYTSADFKGVLTLSDNELNTWNYDYIGLIISNEELIGDGISKGDIVVIQLNAKFENDNSIYAVNFDNDVNTLKRVKAKDHYIVLTTSNAQTKPIILSEKNSFHVFGKLKRVIKKF